MYLLLKRRRPLNLQIKHIKTISRLLRSIPATAGMGHKLTAVPRVRKYRDGKSQTR